MVASRTGSDPGAIRRRRRRMPPSRGLSMVVFRNPPSVYRGPFAFIAAILAGLAFGSPAAQAQGVVKSVHGDWQIRCDMPPGAQSEQCALIQSVTAEDRANVGLSVIVLKTADQKTRLLRVLAPLGVLLP